METPTTESRELGAHLLLASKMIISVAKNAAAKRSSCEERMAKAGQGKARRTSRMAMPLTR